MFDIDEQGASAAEEQKDIMEYLQLEDTEDTMNDFHEK